MDETTIRAVVTAAREATHAASNVATVAALGTRGNGEVDIITASARAAEAAFVLDDIYRRNNGSPPSIEAAAKALAAAETALREARMVLARSWPAVA